MFLFANVYCIEEVVFAAADAHSILVFVAMNAFGTTLTVSCQIFVVFADETNPFTGALASPRTGKLATLTGGTSGRGEVDAVRNGANSI